MKADEIFLVIAIFILGISVGARIMDEVSKCGVV